MSSFLSALSRFNGFLGEDGDALVSSSYPELQVWPVFFFLFSRDLLRNLRWLRAGQVELLILDWCESGKFSTPSKYPNFLRLSFFFVFGALPVFTPHGTLVRGYP